MSDSDQIRASIKDGSYFIEGIDWYKNIFLYPLKYRPISILGGSVLLFLTAITMFYVYIMFPLEERIDVIAPMTDSINFIPRIVQIDKGGKTIRQIVTEALAVRYVESRESFIAKRFKTNYVFVLNNSSKDIFDTYYSLVTSTDQDNPTKLNALNRELHIEILSTQWQDNDNKVTVVFNKKIFDQFRNLLTVSKWKADIEFYLSDYDFTKAHTSKIDFIVTSYATDQIAENS